MPEPGVVIGRLPAGQSLDLFTALSGLLSAALVRVGDVYLTASDAPGTAAAVTLAGQTPESVVVEALRVAAMLLTSDPQARREMERRYRDLMNEPDDGMTLNRLTANEDGSVTFGLGGSREIAQAAAQWILAQFLPALRETQAPNYLCWEAEDAETGDTYLVSITKPDGMSPHATRLRSEAEVERLTGELEQARLEVDGLRADLMEARR